MRVRIVPAPVRPAALATAGLAILFALMATPALAQGPGLPRGYDIERIDSPSPFQAGTFGTQTIPIGDVNNDGEEDIATNQTNGTPQGCVAGPPSTCNNEGQVWVYSGESGGLLGTFTSPDLGGAGNRALVDRWMDRLGDIGSCPANTPAGQTCTSGAVGPPDGHADFFLGAEGVDVGGVRDVGRVYVIDGRTLSVLKRIDMPLADRQLVAARQAQFGPGTNVVAGFGRTAITPRGLPVCAGNAGVTPCPPTTEIPQNVRTGDIDGGGHPEIVIGANFFTEIKETAHPNSHCAQAPANTICHQAGRAYIYRGEDVAGSDPAVILDGSGPGQTPAKVIRNMAAQADTPDQAAFVRAEAFGHAVMPVGDVGTCRSGGTFPVVNPGDRCTVAARTNAPDGKPDVIISAHLADGPAFNPDLSRFNEGVSFVVDGATGAYLHTINHPEPQPSAFFGYTTRQTFPFGQLVGTQLPDYVQASWQNYAGKPAAGRLYVLNGDFNNPFAVVGTLEDPTPTTNERFGVAREGVGDLVPGEEGVEALIGNFPFGQSLPDGNTDVHFMNLLNGQELQRIPDPDRQRDSSFGYQVTPLGDLNEDGFLDFAASSPSWDSPAVGAVAGKTNQGRIYIYRSDNTRPPPTGGGGGGATPRPGPTPAPTFADCPSSASNLIRGSAAGGSITGTPRGDRIFGGTGNDIVDALAGDDCVDLGTGDDRGQGGLGNDLLIGGLGADRVAGSDGNDTLRGNPGSDRLEGGRGNDNVAGDSGNDTLLGLFGNDRLHGVSGKDVISGSRGRDRINGGAGNDRISGGSSGDRIAGDAGSDRINGNSGRDLITGNSGNDRITSLDSSRDRVNCGRGRDRVLADRRDIVSGNCERVSRRR